MKRILFNNIIILIGSLGLLGQSSNSINEVSIQQADTALAIQYLETYDSLLAIGATDQVLSQMKVASKIFKAFKIWNRYVLCLVVKSQCQLIKKKIENSFKLLDSAIWAGKQYLPPDASVYWNIYLVKGDVFQNLNQIDSAKFYLNKALEIIKNTERWEDYIWTELSLSFSYYYLGDLQAMGRALENTYYLAKEYLPSNHEVFDYIYSNQAALHIETGDFEKSLEIGKKALKLRLARGIQTSRDSMELATRYQNLAVFNSNKGEVSLALQENFLALDYYTQLKADNFTIANLLFNISGLYKSSTDLETALSYLYKCLATLNNEHKKSFKKQEAKLFILVYNRIAKCLLEQNSLDSVHYYLNLAIPLSQRFDVHLDICYGSFGLLEKSIGNYKKAIDYFQKAVAANVRYYGNKHTRCDNFFRFIARSCFEMGDYERCLLNCQKGLQNQSEDFDIYNYFYTPSIQKVRDKLGFAKMLMLKIEALKKRGLSNADYLTSNYENCTTVAELTDTLRNSYQTTESKAFLSKNSFSIFESAINIALQLHKKTKKESYLHEAFTFAEKSKALLLLESLQDLEQNYTSEKPELTALLEKQKKLKTNFTFYERKLFDENQKGEKRNQTKIKTWEKTLSELRVEEESVRFRLETEYPDYYNLNYDLSLASVEDIQKTLSQHSDFEKTAFIEYFTGDSAIYTFFISKEEFQVFEMPKNQTLTEAISTFQNLQSTNPALFNSNDLANQYFQKYSESAYFLYQKLMSPILKEKNFEKLIIVADGNLGYLSFEAFLTSLPNSNEANYSTSNLDYLIEKYQISYAYSGTLFLESLKKRDSKATEAYAGFAPVFRQNNKEIASVERGCHEGQLGTLENSERSVRTVHEFLGGNLYLNEQANKAQFIEAAPNYRLLHLSTHACVDDHDPMFNKVYFADDFLPTYELYNLRLNADLVVLSACETGRGELVRGEGIMSLARGFMQAGCPSVITSLWNANDFSTSEIMIDFHRNLKEGQSKDAALRNAKLAYLESSPSRLSSPYFWATFVGIGNMEAMELGSDWDLSVYWIGVLVIFLSLSFAIYLFKRKG